MIDRGVSSAARQIVARDCTHPVKKLLKEGEQTVTINELSVRTGYYRCGVCFRIIPKKEGQWTSP